MKIQQVATRLTFVLAGVLSLGALSPTRIHAQTAAPGAGVSHHTSTTARNGDPTGLVKVVRESTQRFRDVTVAEAEGYLLQFGCVSGSESGAMGLHYVNMKLAGDAELNPTRPEIVIYEPKSDGTLQLIGADYLVFADAWHAKHAQPPQIMGQLLHLFESPNRFGLPAFYTLHVWAWKDNPTGMFVNWHSDVSCEAFKGQNP